MLAVATLEFVADPTTDELEPIPDRAVEHGEVFTRHWVVELILGLVGYTPDRDLARVKLVEPACGTGVFLGPCRATAERRLSRLWSVACRSQGCHSCI